MFEKAGKWVGIFFICVALCSCAVKEGANEIFCAGAIMLIPTIIVVVNILRR